MKTRTSGPSLVLRTFGTEASPKAVRPVSGSIEVRGVQSQGVMAVVKHFAMNEQELLCSIASRSCFLPSPEQGDKQKHGVAGNSVSGHRPHNPLLHMLRSNVDEKTAWELYFPPFQVGPIARFFSMSVSH